jgi:cytochrome c
MDTIPVPRAIPLPFPVAPLTLEVLIVFLFLLHIVFVNLMVGGSLLTLAFELLGRRKKELDTVAREIAKTITVNKSLAVVLGVGPLLVMNLLYTVHFYSANALTGTAWIMIVPLVSAAFLATYAHKYSWDVLADNKGLHIAIGALASSLFLLVPFVFLANVNLMLFPDRWGDVRGFLTAVILPNVLPRYVHFLVASMAVTGLFLAWYFGRRTYPAEKVFSELGRSELRRRFLSIAFAATGVQLIAGPLVFFTLPSQGLSWSLAINISLGASLAVAALFVLWRAIQAPATPLGARYWTIVALLTGTVVFMAYGRHLYREEALEAHIALMAQATEEWQAEVLAAQMRAATGQQRVREEAAASPGERVFVSICMGCHARNSRLVGPSLTEIALAYRGDPSGLIAWVKAPGRKRRDYPEMPPVKLTEVQYQDVAAYILGDSTPPGS